MRLKTLGKNREITLIDYTEGECSEIIRESESFVLECVNKYGKDYGGEREKSESVTHYEEIIPERILVRDGHFAGVLILTEYFYYNGGGNKEYRETALLIDGTGEKSAVGGTDFSNDDHSRWDYTTYYLITRPEDL